jgi:pimeloyl-ACP methyl ester carboxylesterase
MAARVGGDAFIRQQRAILGRQDALAVLKRIAVPTLVAVGEDDVLTPVAESETIQRGIRDARLHLFRDCGHLPPLEKPAETIALLRAWLEWARPSAC